LDSFLSLSPRPPPPTLFPYTTLFRSRNAPHRDPEEQDQRRLQGGDQARHLVLDLGVKTRGRLQQDVARSAGFLTHGHQLMQQGRDRKSTRLNSSHVKISYAVFCLKKK